MRNASDTRVIGNEAQGTMGRRKNESRGPFFPFRPLRANFSAREKLLGTRQVKSDEATLERSALSLWV